MRKRAEQAGTDLFLLMSGALDASEKSEVSTAKILTSFDRAVQLGLRWSGSSSRPRGLNGRRD